MHVLVGAPAWTFFAIAPPRTAAMSLRTLEARCSQYRVASPSASHFAPGTVRRTWYPALRRARANRASAGTALTPQAMDGVSGPGSAPFFCSLVGRTLAG